MSEVDGSEPSRTPTVTTLVTVIDLLEDCVRVDDRECALAFCRRLRELILSALDTDRQTVLAKF